jgi:hypothetical protein
MGRAILKIPSCEKQGGKMIWLSLLAAACAIAVRAAQKVVNVESRASIRTASNVIGAIAIIVGLLSPLTVVPAGHVGVPVVFGSVQDQPLSEGLNMVNPFAQVVNMTVRTETYTMSAVRDEGAVKGDDSIQFPFRPSHRMVS